jgi:hypothetical protein
MVLPLWRVLAGKDCPPAAAAILSKLVIAATTS